MRVAIIGAGPAGLVAARYLKGQGFTPVLIEAHEGPGGQWDAANPLSGIWPQMRTNTARMLTRFSDLDYPDKAALFPRSGEVLDYLRAYAEAFGLLEHARFGTRVTHLDRQGEGYRLTLQRGDVVVEEDFPRAVIASGRYNAPEIPAVHGLATFAGGRGAIHAFRYKEPERYRGKRVLVAGGNISSLEIASDLAMLGAASVSICMRRQRYVIPKLIAGTPTESYRLTRGAALWREQAGDDEIAARSLAFALQYGGDPARHGAPAADPDIRKAGTSNSQHFLHLVAEDRIDCRPWLASVEGSTAVFTDRSSAAYDAIIFGTGYRLNLPFLSEELRRTLEVSDRGLALSDHTLHPDLPGLGVIGLYAQVGPYLPTLEQQARYLAYAWSGAVTPPTSEALRLGLDRCRAASRDELIQHVMSIRFARLAGVDPEGRVPAGLASVLMETAVTPASFRLAGPEPVATAADTVLAEARRFGRPGILPQA